MKIAIDFREGAKLARAGKGEYIFQLVSAWIKAPTDEVTLLIERGQTVSLILPVGWRVLTVPATGFWWQFLVIAWLEFLRPVKVYFSATSLIAPAFVRSVKTVTTLADFTVWRFPAKHFPHAVWIERLCMLPALRYSSHLLAISEFTKREAIALFQANSAKITVIPLAVGPEFNSAELISAEAEALRQKYHLPKTLWLYLGTIEPRKNISRMITAFSRVSPNFPELNLVLAGARGWFADEVLAHQPDNVIVTGYVDSADRPALYKLAQAFIFPSLYEGFGLPPLEAMTCGTPVLTSRVASLPEVVDDSALLVDPTDIDGMVSAMNQLASSAELRSSLSQRGLVQSQKFSWDNTLALTRQAIHKYE